MKVKKIKFNNHKVLKNLEVDFINERNEPLEIVVFIGDNGTGKTQLLKSIVDGIENAITKGFRIHGTQDGAEIVNKETTLFIDEIQDVAGFHKDWGGVFVKPSNKSFVVWMPAELDIEKGFQRIAHSSHFVEWASQWTLESVSEHIIKVINEALYENQDKVSSKVIADKCREFNDIFEILNLDIKLKGVSKELPIFENSAGETFNINDLSSGEKQLFFRLLSLKRLSFNNAIIIIDEPENSLHPDWQRKVIEVYKQIGENNQLIIATHSPFIVGSVPSESIRIMKKDSEGKIQVEQQDENNKTYGKNVDEILEITMGLDSLRDEKTTKKFNRVLELLETNAYETPEYEKLMNELKKQLGTTDIDIMRIEMGKSVRMRRNVEN